MSLDKNDTIVGIIADTSNEIFNTIGLKIGDIAGNDLARVISNVNNANQRSIKTNENNNEGLVRRRKLYNDIVGNNNDLRVLEFLIPVNIMD